jgi:hypothetical protein
MSQQAILKVVRAVVGRRCRITRADMRLILADLAAAGLVQLGNGWGGSRPDQSYHANAAAWTETCRDLTVVSVLAARQSHPARVASSNPGEIRYDQPGSMHPQMRACVMFMPAGQREGTVEFLRRRCRRLLTVTDAAADVAD